MARIPVRAFGSEAVHLADVPENMLVEAKVFGSSFTGVPLPVAMLCGVVLRRKYNYVLAVKMLDDAKINCRACRRVRELVSE